MVPPLPSDVSDLGGSSAGDARLFPSDDELIQRTIWNGFLLVLGWTIIGLAIAIPLYLVDTPCFGRTIPSPQYTGEYSALQDLSILRLLRLLENGSINTSVQTRSITTLSLSGVHKRLIVNGVDEAHKARVRLLVLTIILLVLSVLPALGKLLREFNALVAYRKRWLSLRCEGYEMGWLSKDRVPGLDGMGEKEIKDMIVKYGLSTSLEQSSEGQRRRREDIERRYGASVITDDLNGSLALPAQVQEDGAEIDVTGIFSIV